MPTRIVLSVKLQLPGIAFFYFTGKSFSEALILAPVNPQYDDRLFIEFQKKIKVHNIVYKYCFECQNKKQKKKLHSEFNEYCGLSDSRMRASEKDLPAYRFFFMMKYSS